jgi:hypothetical protein
LHQQTGLKFIEGTSEVYIWSTTFCGAETGTLREVYQKYLGSFEMRCWRRMERISWTGHVRHQGVLRRVKERIILHTIKLRRANWIGHILHMNCPLRHIIEGKT